MTSFTIRRLGPSSAAQATAMATIRKQASTRPRILKRPSVVRVNAKQAWAVLAAGVFSYEIYCKDGELLSEAVDHWLVSRPILTRTIIAAFALHLANALPVQFDCVSLGFNMVRAASRWSRQQLSTRSSAWQPLIGSAPALH
jgi:hypothetical protein